MAGKCNGRGIPTVLSEHRHMVCGESHQMLNQYLQLLNVILGMLLKNQLPILTAKLQYQA